MLLYRHGSGDRYCSMGGGPFRVVMEHHNKDPYRVVTNISSFGNGLERGSRFGIYTSWADIQDMIQKLADAGHPKAVKMVEDLATMERIRAAMEPPVKDEEPEAVAA